jgi:Rap1a immunity proteins
VHLDRRSIIRLHPDGTVLLLALDASLCVRWAKRYDSGALVMRWVLAVLAILCSSTFSAHGSVESANELLSSCEDFLDAYRPSGVGFTLQPEGGPAYECWGYINAILQLSALTDHGRTLTGACLAPATSALQIIEVVVAYLQGHPQELHERAGVEAVYALRQAFPCGK